MSCDFKSQCCCTVSPDQRAVHFQCHCFLPMIKIHLFTKNVLQTLLWYWYLRYVPRKENANLTLLKRIIVALCFRVGYWLSHSVGILALLDAVPGTWHEPLSSWLLHSAVTGYQCKFSNVSLRDFLWEDASEGLCRVGWDKWYDPSVWSAGFTAHSARLAQWVQSCRGLGTVTACIARSPWFHALSHHLLYVTKTALCPSLCLAISFCRPIFPWFKGISLAHEPSYSEILFLPTVLWQSYYMNKNVMARTTIELISCKQFRQICASRHREQQWSHEADET